MSIYPRLVLLVTLTLWVVFPVAAKTNFQISKQRIIGSKRGAYKAPVYMRSFARPVFRTREIRTYSGSSPRKALIPRTQQSILTQQGQVEDLVVSKHPDNFAFAQAKIAVTNIFLQKMKAKLNPHIDRVYGRHVSVAFYNQFGRPSQLDLNKLLGSFSPSVISEVRNHLQQIESLSSARWSTEIMRMYYKLKPSKNHFERQIADGLDRVRVEMESLVVTRVPSKAEVKAKFIDEFGSKLLRRRSWQKTARLLPSNLPMLPSSATPEIQALVKRAKTIGHITEQVAYLERQAAILRGAYDESHQDLGGQLIEYLTDYKKTWDRDWLAQRMRRFASASNLRDRKPSYGLIFEKGLSDVCRVKVEEEGKEVLKTVKIKEGVDEAWRILQGLVHPDLLRSLPPLKVYVRDSTMGDFLGLHNKTRISIKIRPEHANKDELVDTILHEVGHHIEDFGWSKISVLSNVIQVRRAFGMNPGPWKGKTDKGFKAYGGQYEGGFLYPYSGIYYTSGNTEVISMGLGFFSNKQKALDFFREDGEYALFLLEALQNKP